MNIPKPAEDIGTLAEDARDLLSTTAHWVGDPIDEARQGLATALGDGRAVVDRVRGKAVEGAVAAGDAVRHHPFQAMAIGFGIGATVGYFVSRRCSRV